MSEIRTIPPKLTASEWNALLDHSLESGATYTVRKDGVNYDGIHGSGPNAAGYQDYTSTSARTTIQNCLTAIH